MVSFKFILIIILGTVFLVVVIFFLFGLLNQLSSAIDEIVKKFEEMVYSIFK